MFNFKNISKIFSYNWSKTIKNLLPKGNKTLMQDQESKNINNGAILRIISVVLAQVATIGVAVCLIMKSSRFLGISGLASYAINEAIRRNMVLWVIEIVIAAALPIGILVYNNIMKKKEQNGWPVFIILILSALQMLYTIYLLIGWTINMIVAPIFALIGMVSVFLTFLGNVHVSVGCIDFLEKQAKSYNEIHSGNTLKMEPIKPLPVEEVPRPKFCPNCGAPINHTGAFCEHCGTKL